MATMIWMWLIVTLTLLHGSLVLASSASGFSLPSDFYENKCDPCISRTESLIHVLVASSSLGSAGAAGSRNSAEEEEWNYLYIRSAMEQASRDTRIRLEFSVYHVDDRDQDEAARMANDIRRLGRSSTEDDQEGERRVSALIVALPPPSSSTTGGTPSSSRIVQDAVADALQMGLPVFGFGAGYQAAPAVGFLGFVAYDDFHAGQLVGQELRDRLLLMEEEADSSPATNYQHKALFITDAENAGMQDRFRGIQSTFDNHVLGENLPNNSSNTTTSATPLQMEWQAAFLRLDDPTAGGVVTASSANGNTSFLELLSPDDIFKDCPYDVIVADGDVIADSVLVALEERGNLDGCAVRNRTTAIGGGGLLMATFGLSPQIHRGILQRTIAFAAVRQLYLQSAFVVVMASVFVTTGKKLALPIESNEIYLSGPSIYALDYLDRLPENSFSKCREAAFPVCDPESDEMAPFDSPLLSSALRRAPITDSRTCNARGCSNRADIRLAGVLHGTTTSLFWRPIYAAAHKIAEDLGVTLEMSPEEPTQNPEKMWEQMSDQIVSFCERGIDGLIVTIPDEALLDAIRFCLDREVPIVSINAGAQFSDELGLMVHIGQMEYNAGYGAGERLVDEGMKEGYCLIHNLGNIALQSRCQGFEDAIANHEDVVYHGMVEVSGDDVARSVLAVESAVEKNSGSTSWDGIALLSLSMSLIDAILELSKEHPDVMLATFDFGDKLYQPLRDGRLKFAIDQQSLLQGIMPVYLLTYAAYTKQGLVNKVVETGPHFVDAPPTADQQICERHHFNTCAAIPFEQMNKLPSEVVAIGYVMVALTLAGAIICVAWTKYHWKKSELVQVSQPPFLFTLAAGIVISTLSIVFMSIEAEYPTTKSLLTGRLTNESSPDIGKANAACMAVPWLHSIGSAIVFASLFSKIWKIKLIFQAGARFRRVTIGLKNVLPYAMILLAVVVSLLTAWQIADPFVWTRTVELEDSVGLTLESYGECTSDTGWYFWIALLSFQLAYLIYALVLCWQTKDIPTSFAEGNHVSLCVVCIFQVSVLAIPITAMVRDDPTAYYFVRACAVFLQNFTVLCLIFGPKMWRVQKGMDKLTIRSGSVTMQRQSWTQGQSSGNVSPVRGQPRRNLQSENAELVLHILDLESIGKGSTPKQEGSTPTTDLPTSDIPNDPSKYEAGTQEEEPASQENNGIPQEDPTANDNTDVNWEEPMEEQTE